jgi:hypothetical protein
VTLRGVPTRRGGDNSARFTGFAGVRRYGVAVGIPTSVWFIIAAVALVIGLLMLRGSQHSAGGSQPRDRRRWAEQKEWEYLDSDPVLTSRWRYGTIHQGGPGVARNLVTGSVPTSEGRRLIYVFDHEQAGHLTSVVCAVQRRSSMKGAFELRLPSAPLPDDAGLDLLEPVGQRYAFVSDAAVVRPLITPRLVRAADDIGDDVELLWAEDSWVLCTAPLDYDSDQLQHLLDQLVEMASALEEASRSARSSESAPRLPAGAGATGSGSAAAPGPGATGTAAAAGSGAAAAGWARSLSGRSAARRAVENAGRTAEGQARRASDSGARSAEAPSAGRDVPGEARDVAGQARDSADQARDAAGDAAARARDAAGQARDPAGDAAARARESAGQARDSAARTGDTARADAEDAAARTTAVPRRPTPGPAADTVKDNGTADRAAGSPDAPIDLAAKRAANARFGVRGGAEDVDLGTDDDA